MPVNFKASPVNPEPSTSNRKYLFKRPTQIPWNQLELNFSPQLGQSIRVRETYKVNVVSNGLATVYANSNRYLSNTNIGYWQHLYKDFEGEYTIEREGQMNVPFLENAPEILTHTSSYEWEYHIYRNYKDFTGASFSTVDACNADLEPAAVPNGFISEANVLDYVKLTQKLAGKDFIGVLEDVINLTKTTTNGFRFPDKKNLFTVLNQILVVDLETYDLPTAIGDLGICIHPGYTLLGCEHTIECREFGKIESLSNQIDPVSCSYLPGFAYPFPSDLKCPAELAQFVDNQNTAAEAGTSCGDETLTYSVTQAQALEKVEIFNSPGYTYGQRNYAPPIALVYICSNGGNMTYWRSQGVSGVGCN